MKLVACVVAFLGPIQASQIRIEIPPVTAGMTAYPVRMRLPEGALPQFLRGRSKGRVCLAKPDGLIAADFLRVNEREIELFFAVRAQTQEELSLQVVPCPESANADSDSVFGVAEDQVGFTLTCSDGLELKVPRTLFGLFLWARRDGVDFLRPGSLGLVLYYRGAPLGAGLVSQDETKRARWVTIGSRENRVLQAQTELPLPGGVKLLGRARLWCTEVAPWVELAWELEGAVEEVTALGLDLNLNGPEGVYPVLLAENLAVYKLAERRYVFAAALNADADIPPFQAVPDSRLVLVQHFKKAGSLKSVVRIGFFNGLSLPQLSKLVPAFLAQVQISIHTVSALMPAVP